MAELVPIQLGGESYQARSGGVSSQRCVNLYLEQNPSTQKGPVTLYGTPGLKRWGTFGSGPIRGMCALGPKCYIVSGSTLYAAGWNGDAVEVGSIAGSGPVRMVANATHVAIATQNELYAANLDGVISLPESGMSSVAYQDGYVIFTQAGTEKFWLSGLDDLTTIDALDFSSADAFADALVGCVSNHRELWLFGERSTEGWYNSGNATFPFERAQGAFLEIGCKAAGSIAKAQRSVLWLGHDLYVYAAQGYQAQKISTHGIDRLISEVSDPTAAEAFVYDQDGHTFYELSFPLLTIVYDLSTGLWHERKSEGMSRHRVGCYSAVFGKRLVGDIEDGRVYELDLDTYDDDGDTITRSVSTPTLFAATRKVTLARLSLDMDAGVGLTAGQGSDPRAMLDWSDDGGVTWGPRIEAAIGPLGARKYEVIWGRLGSFRQRTLRVSISDPIRVAITGAYASLEGAIL
jgi:hypothetical protein